MAGPKKKKSDAQQDSDSENMDIDTTIIADFEGRNPGDSDFHGIQQLLKQLFLKAHINVGQISNMIIEQQGLGSVLKQSLDDDGDEEDQGNPNDVFGVTTVVNLTRYKDNECVKQLLHAIDELVEKHAEKKVQEQIKNILSMNDKKFGLLINERFINIPAKIADPLMETLYQEMDRIAKKNPMYNFDYYIMICKTYKQLTKDKKEEETIFINPEEEIFSKASDVHFEFSVANETDVVVGGLWTEDDKQMIPHRRILILNSLKMPDIVQNVKTFVA